MIVKAQILPKTFLVITMFLSSTNAVASYWLECIGSITLKSKISENITHATNKEKYITADILIHDHTFTCRGHDRKINKKGFVESVNIFLSASLNEKTLEEGINLLVKFDYSDWRGASVSEGNSTRKWTALEVIKTIPAQKITADIESENQKLLKEKEKEKEKENK